MEYIYLLPVLFSAIGSLLCILPFLKFEEDISVIVAIGALATSIYILFLPNYTTDFFYIDGLSKIFLVMTSAIYLAAVIFSIYYIDHIQNKLFQSHFYFFLLNTFVLTMLFTVILNNLGLIWVAVEATTVTSALLISTENDESTIEATWRYVIIVSVGLIISLIAIIFIYSSFKTLSFADILKQRSYERITYFGAVLGIIGFGTKAGIFPMHTWLPDAHGKAPSPISAIFSAVLLPVALFAIERILQAVPDNGVKVFAFTLGLLSIALAAFMSFNQVYYKRMFAYSSIDNMGIALIGLSLGGYAFVGSILIILAHAFAKSATFFLTGNVLINYESWKIDDVKGISKTLPATGYSLFFGSLAVTGTPPFGTFLGELLILISIFNTYGVMITLLTGLFLAMAFIGINYQTLRMVFSEPNIEKRKENYIVIIPIINLLLALAVTFASPLIYNILFNGVWK
ncbi:MAG: proton-conducting transporter transmembrane domain-containing protein [Ignavibacteriaceae bacterium]